LGGVELLGAGAEEALLETGDDLVLTGDFGLEVGIFGLQTGELFLKFAEAVEELLGFCRGAVFH
jgi:hypothetical protein